MSSNPFAALDEDAPRAPAAKPAAAPATTKAPASAPKGTNRTRPKERLICREISDRVPARDRDRAVVHSLELSRVNPNPQRFPKGTERDRVT